MISNGFVYVQDGSDDPMSEARQGAKVRIRPRLPPWIVVYHSLEAVTVARWPGKLWSVRLIDPVTDADLIAADRWWHPEPDAGYTRAFGVDVVKDLPPACLFGENGEAVCAVIAQASRLEIADVSALAAARHADAGRAYSTAWNKYWAMSRQSPWPYEGEDLTGTLGLGTTPRSPINCAFSVISRAVWERAESIAGSSAFIPAEKAVQWEPRSDDEALAFALEEEPDSLEPTWSAAQLALLEAAMGLGAPNLSTNEDRIILTQAWRKVVGPAP